MAFEMHPKPSDEFLRVLVLGLVFFSPCDHVVTHFLYAD